MDSINSLAPAFILQGTTLARYEGSEERVIIPEGITEIGPRAFENRRLLKSIFVPSTMQKMGCMAFSGCDSLIEVRLDNLRVWYDIEFDGYCSNPLSLGASLIADEEPVSRIIIPSDITELPSKLFKGCISLEEVVIPSHLRRIGAQAFDSCKRLSSVSFSEGLEEIGECAFSKCEELVHITLPRSVKCVGNGAFSYARSLASLDLPDPIATIGISAFRYCQSLTTFQFPPNVTEVADFVLEGCSGLRSVVLPPHASRIGKRAFASCTALHDLIVPETVNEVAGDAFEDSRSLARIVYAGHAIPKSLKIRTNTAFIAPQIPLDAYSGTLVLPQVALAGIVANAADNRGVLSEAVIATLRTRLQETCEALRYDASSLRYLISNQLISVDDATQLATTCSKRGMVEVTAMLMELIASNADDDLEL